MHEKHRELIPHVLKGEVISQRARDGYINATAMCKAAGKELKHYNENKGSAEFVEELSRSVGIPTDLLIQVIRTGPNELRGTWVHPYIAVNLATWLSPAFAVHVAKWVFEWMTQGRVPLESFERLVRRYLSQGRPEEWIRERIEGILTRRELTDWWRDHGIKSSNHYATLTRLLQIQSVGLGPKEHRELKGLSPRQSVRNQSTELELLFTRLGERSAVEIARATNADGYAPNKSAVLEAGEIAKSARLKLEALTGEPIASSWTFQATATPIAASSLKALPSPDRRAT